MKEIHGACPLNCPDGCAWTVTVDDTGVPVKLRGRSDHPFTRGSLCVKVNSYLEHTKSADRLLYPLRRIGPKGSGEFERISWDEAFEVIAARFGSVIDEFGPAAIWRFSQFLACWMSWHTYRHPFFIAFTLPCVFAILSN